MINIELIYKDCINNAKVDKNMVEDIMSSMVKFCSLLLSY
jgi:hypothetical protein